MTINRAFANILSDDLAGTRDFFVDLLGFTVVFDSDWFVNLQAPDNPLNELGIWRREHELVPEAYRGRPQGAVLTFVVDDVEAVYARAVAAGTRIVEPPRETFYGQRSMLVEDPNGQVIDVSTPGTPSPEFLAEMREKYGS
ncbi:VOC family protein [Streptomyces sp. PU-14G]|uniref:VOC family protein n=1 Tax=Streptomyces sp. PU-14G TaxID=2800808 RepID=UPI0034DEFC31